MTRYEDVTLPETTVPVLTQPLTYAQYETDPSVVDGVIAAVVSLDPVRLIESDYDSNVDYLAENVVGELGEDWTVLSYRVLGADPRHTQPEELRILVRVELYPGAADTAGADELFSHSRDVAQALDRLPFAVAEQARQVVMGMVVSYRRHGHHLTLDATEDDLGDGSFELLLSCTQCPLVHQLVLDNATGALADESVEGDADGACPGK